MAIAVCIPILIALPTILTAFMELTTGIQDMVGIRLTELQYPTEGMGIMELLGATALTVHI